VRNLTRYSTNGLNIHLKPYARSIYIDRRWGKIDLTVVQEEIHTRYVYTFELRKLLHGTELCVQLKINERDTTSHFVGKDGDCNCQFLYNPTSDPAVVTRGRGVDRVANMILRTIKKSSVSFIIFIIVSFMSSWVCS
jgi:endoglucanase Acf2